MSVRAEGFSLLEVVIPLFILSLLALGIVSGTISARKASEKTVYNALAETISLGFLEQLKSVEYPFLSMIADEDGQMQFLVEQGSTIDVALNQDAFTAVQVPLDAGTDGAATRFLEYEFRPRVIVDDDWPLLTIIIDYRWMPPLEAEWRSHQLVVGRSAVPAQ